MTLSRRRRSGARLLRPIIVVTVFMFGIYCKAEELTLHQEQGRQIFTLGAVEGETPPHARIGAGSTSVPSTVAPCANCHGEDGHGGSEGTIVAPDITWKSLSNPVGKIKENGRRSDFFTEQSFATVLTQGVYPSGGKLNPVMPRYGFTSEQIHALAEYLKIIEADQSPGVTVDTIRIGLLQPEKPELQAASESTLSILRSVFDALNRQGGIFGRRIDVEFVGPTQISRDRSGYGRPHYFALLDPFLIAPGQIGGTGEGMIPLIAGAAPLNRGDNPSPNREFFLFGGMREHIEVLFAYLASLPEGDRAQIAVVGEKDLVSPELSRHVVQCSRVYRWPSPIYETYDSGDFDAAKITERLRSQAVSAMLYLGDQDKFHALLAQFDTQAWSPVLLLPTPVIDDRAFNFSGIISRQFLMTYPFNPQDQSRQGDFWAVRHSAGVAAGNLALQRMAYGLSQVLIGGLKDAGRELSITRFVSALERMKNQETGVSHPVSYGPGRRIGAPGAYIFGIDVTTRRLIQKSEWLEAGDQARGSKRIDD